MTDLPTGPAADADAPPFDAIDTHAGLVAWSRAYARRLVAVTDLAVDLDPVAWEVSTRAKRRAAAVLHPRLDDATLGDPPNWSSLADVPDAQWPADGVGTPDGAGTPADAAGDPAHTDDGPTAAASEAIAAVDSTAQDDTDSTADDADRTDGSGDPGPPACTVRLTWDAAREYDRGAWAGTLRHELIHVEQFQRFGTTGHDAGFERRAAALETTVRCERFATPKYVLTCPDCGTVVARRYRDCKLVRRHEAYRSQCCEAPLELTRTGATD